MRSTKRSSHITLLFLGLLATSGCDDDPSHRDVYTTKEDCLKDWNTPEQCEQQQGGVYSHSWYGPHYYGGTTGNTVRMADGSTYVRPSNHATQSIPTTVTRGGLGQTGHAMAGSAHSGGGGT